MFTFRFTRTFKPTKSAWNWPAIPTSVGRQVVEVDDAKKIDSPFPLTRVVCGGWKNAREKMASQGGNWFAVGV